MAGMWERHGKFVTGCRRRDTMRGTPVYLANSLLRSSLYYILFLYGSERSPSAFDLRQWLGKKDGV